ncbi:cephalotoxin-like protein [Lates calcarifer]|uniref:Cephalotoxin-like protein n=1 Tax=Lates calcarifer TaxID=8187 RepID=A0A4W6G7Q6_LATCA|nr:cephalotoxin-like protein [Lates calcarifer]
MASPRWSTSMLLASLILLLYWTTSSARSHDSTSTDLSPPHRVRRALPFRTREEVAASMQTAKDVLNFINDRIGKKNIETLSSVLKGISNIASTAPVIGGLVSSIVNVVLAFVPQENPLKELREGFAEVNRKLDSLSLQISNLATDVEWFNYASVYSQDEVRILNAWKKFDEFRENSGLVNTAEDKLRLAEIFTNYYENTAVEASVANLYHYLTVSSTSLSGNLNNLLKKKFKCNIGEIGKYNIYFSSLLWRGMVLNQLYWDLIGFSSSRKQAVQTEMFKTVSEAQISAVKFCLKNYTQYLEKDVEEISKAMSPDNKTAIADQVKTFLDKKYNWYNWVVLVYNTDQKSNFILYNMKEFHSAKVTVAVSPTLKADKLLEDHLKELGNDCFVRKQCDQVSELEKQCVRFFDVSGQRLRLRITDFVKVTHVTYGDDFAQFPEPFHTAKCQRGSSTWGELRHKISMYFSQSLSVCSQGCDNGGKCERLLDSNDWLCECPDGFYGDRCEKEFDIRNDSETDLQHPVPDISTLDVKLDKMESKLQEILNKLNERCPRQ